MVETISDAVQEHGSITEIVLETGQGLHDALASVKAGISPSEFYQQVLAFINMLSTLDPGGALTVRSASPGSSVVLFQSRHGRDSERAAPATALHAGLLRDAERKTVPGAPVALAAALSRALCHINRLRGAPGPGAEAGPEVPARILCILASAEPVEQHIALMNAVFAAQRDGVAVDCCKLGPTDAAFAQHAAQLTGGVYLRPGLPRGLLQYLLMAFAAAPDARGRLELPNDTGVEGGATCMCHRRPLHMGYVCSVCLSVFCEAVPACLTCGAEFGPGAPCDELDAVP